MVIPYPKTAVALIVAVAMVAPTQAATPSAAAAAPAASAARSPSPAGDSDIGSVAHPAALLLATIAAIGFVTRRLRD